MDLDEFDTLTQAMSKLHGHHEFQCIPCGSGIKLKQVSRKKHIAVIETRNEHVDFLGLRYMHEIHLVPLNIFIYTNSSTHSM